MTGLAILGTIAIVAAMLVLFGFLFDALDWLAYGLKYGKALLVDFAHRNHAERTDLRTWREISGRPGWGNDL